MREKRGMDENVCNSPFLQLGKLSLRLDSQPVLPPRIPAESWAHLSSHVTSRPPHDTEPSALSWDPFKRMSHSLRHHLKYNSLWFEPLLLSPLVFYIKGIKPLCWTWSSLSKDLSSCLHKSPHQQAQRKPEKSRVVIGRQGRIGFAQVGACPMSCREQLASSARLSQASAFLPASFFVPHSSAQS